MNSWSSIFSRYHPLTKDIPPLIRVSPHKLTSAHRRLVRNYSVLFEADSCSFERWGAKTNHPIEILLYLAPALQAGQRTIYESSLMRDHPVSPYFVRCFHRSIYNRGEFRNASLNRGAKKFGHRLGQKPWNPLRGMASVFNPLCSPSPPCSSNRFFSVQGWNPRLEILVDDEFWMAAQSPPHIPIGIQPSLSLLIPLSASVSSAWLLPRRASLTYLSVSGIYTHRFYTITEPEEPTRTPSTLLPLLNRTHLCSSAARSLWTAKSCHGPSFTSESEAWLEPIQPSGCDSSAKGCGVSRATREQRRIPRGS